MDNIISEDLLIEELNHLRYIITNYDFSEVSNVVFYNIESLSLYLEQYKNNPFERQYKEIEKSLSILSPYLPIDISKNDYIFDLSYLFKDDIIFFLKLDFIEKVKSIKSEDEWSKLVNSCKELRTKLGEKIKSNVSLLHTE